MNLSLTALQLPNLGGTRVKRITFLIAAALVAGAATIDAQERGRGNGRGHSIGRGHSEGRGHAFGRGTSPAPSPTEPADQTTHQVPEPTSLTLLALAACGLIARHLRARAS